MSLLAVVIVLIIVGIALWAFNNYVTIVDPKFKTLINILVIVAAVVWILQLMGIFNTTSIPFPRVN